MTYEEACEQDLCQGCGGVTESRIAVNLLLKTYQLCHECAGDMLQDALQNLPLGEKARIRQIFIKHGG